MSQSQSYKKLFSNTLIFALGTFGSKVLVLLLVPLYTACLSPAEYGTVDLIAQTANILIPIITLSASDAALRFALETKDPVRLRKIYSSLITIVLCGFAVLGLCYPIFNRMAYLDGNTLLLLIYVCTSSLKQLNATYIRALEKVKLYAVDGIITTLTMILLNILFLIVFDMGMTGYLLAIILSDLLSSVFLFITGKLWRHISLQSITPSLMKEMLRYSIPMIPTTLLWLITSISDRFIITYFHGEYANGINSIAYKIPTILTTIFTMFSNAWNMSAITENESSDRSEFYTTVFSLNQAFMYVIAAGVLMLNKPITIILVDSAYYEAYKYSPILVLATVFTCFNVFLGSAYIACKKTKRSFATSLAAGVINIILNFAFIPEYGIYGAAIATFISYFVVFFFRLYDTKAIIGFDFKLARIPINTVLLIAMAIINQFDGLWIYLPLVVIFFIVLIINFKDLWKCLVFIIPKKIADKLPIIDKISAKILK